MTATPPADWVCSLPLSPRLHIAGGFRLGPERTRPRLVPRPQCVFCVRPVAEGDVLACEVCRVKLDATVMPWDGAE